VQALPSSQPAVLFVWAQPVAGLHASSVQGLSSLQSGATLPTQTPPAHTSTVVQALSSSQGAVLFVWTQPPTESQLSSVQGLLSSQFGADPATHTPPVHTSGVVQALPSLQGDPSGRAWSAGQVVVVPLHTSAASHWPDAPRHSVPALPAGCWQAMLAPSHTSAVHVCPSPGHGVPAEDRASAGHVALPPVQVSAGSQTPAELRQVVLEDTNTFAGHAALVPVQVSATSQIPPVARHTAPALPAGRWHVPDSGALSVVVQAGPAVRVPFWAGVVASPAEVPVFSFRLQRPIRLASGTNV
jgi:hypothetical protein